MPEGEWRTVTARDNWGYLEYEPTFTKVQKVRVRWPDGTVTAEFIKAKTWPITIHDMGHSYEMEQVRYGIVVDVRGVPAWVDLKGLEVQEVTRSWASSSAG